MFKFSAVSQIWKKYIQKLNDWDLPLNVVSYYKVTQLHSEPFRLSYIIQWNLSKPILIRTKEKYRIRQVGIYCIGNHCL